MKNRISDKAIDYTLAVLENEPEYETASVLVSELVSVYSEVKEYRQHQIPKHAIWNDLNAIWLCPCCKLQILWRNSICHECGQKISW